MQKLRVFLIFISVLNLLSTTLANYEAIFHQGEYRHLTQTVFWLFVIALYTWEYRDAKRLENRKNPV